MASHGISQFSRIVLATFGVLAWLSFANAEQQDYVRARWDPIHFNPEIQSATNEQCLSCHQEILDYRPREVSPAGVKAHDSLAWYQTVDTYQGEQDSFHRRHLVGPMATELMNMQCTTCHQGNSPREEAPVPPTSDDAGYTLRKMVNPDVCLMCHGKMDHAIMGLPSPWSESSAMFGNNCLTCHAAFRTARHQVNFLQAEAIEAAGGETCYGCHGGRAWYRISYPYARNPWPNMPSVVPDWAKDRPTESNPRFQIKDDKSQQAAKQ